MRRSKFTLLAILLFGCTEPMVPGSVEAPQRHPTFSLSAAANEAVLPSGYASLMGETNNSFPHSQKNLRYQQVFQGSDVVDPTIVGLCLRRDDLFGGSSITQTLTIKLGPTSLDYTNLGVSFDANYSAPATEVFSGDVVIPASAGGGTPADFDLCIPFTQSYVHLSGSNVIVEVVNSSLTSSGRARDACADGVAQCTTARAFAFSATAEDAVLVQQGGLVMKFISPEPPPPVEPVTKDDCKQGGWADFGFRNQGQCIRFVETGMDSRS
ncbi:MAG: hypothetical protein ABI556_16060 [Gemmatimonadales bacterium]